MKTNRNIKKWSSVLLVLLFLIGVVVISIPVEKVYAESNTTPSATTEPNDTRIDKFSKVNLEGTHKLQSRLIEILNNQLQKASKMETRAQQHITELTQQGKDASSLENSLNKFYNLIASAKQAKDKALAVFNLHQGFDNQGKVIDLKLARETNINAEMNIRLCRKNITRARRIIAIGLKDYKQQNSTQPASGSN